MKIFTIALIISLSFFSCKGDKANQQQANQKSESKKEVTQYEVKIIKTYPHDTKAYTQGFEYYNGSFYEGTGQHGASGIRKVEIETGKILKQVGILPTFFGEGITILNEKLFQLTWQNRKGFVYDLESFKHIAEFKYQTEGWGLTNDGKSLIMSDGTAKLFFIDPDTYNITRTVEVKDYLLNPVGYLNELEYINGEVWANIWGTHQIIRIDPATGNINSAINLSLLWKELDNQDTAEVLNGIAYNKETGQIFVTGKYWSKIFEIQLVQISK